jgi:hypothetical protein
MDIIVIANCQAWLITQMLRSVPGISVVRNIDINTLGTEQYQAGIEACLAAPSDTLIVSHSLSDMFGALGTESLRKAGKNVLTMTNVYFTGVHPDITYIGGFQGRVKSPTGDYHSKLVLASYLMGFSQADCAGFFRADIYEKAGYFAEFAKSSAELRRRDEKTDIKFAETFLRLVVQQPALMVVNHPTLSVADAQARSIIDHAGGNYIAFPPAFMHNTLAENAWWPVFPEIAEEHRLQYQTPLTFKLPKVAIPITLQEFIAGSYEAYEAGDAQIKAAVQSPGLLKTFQFLQ